MDIRAVIQHHCFTKIDHRAARIGSLARATGIPKQTLYDFFNGSDINSKWLGKLLDELGLVIVSKDHVQPITISTDERTEKLEIDLWNAKQYIELLEGLIPPSSASPIAEQIMRDKAKSLADEIAKLNVSPAQRAALLAKIGL